MSCGVYCSWPLLQSRHADDAPCRRPYRFYSYSHEPNEPSHVYADRNDFSAKFWPDPVQLAANFGFRTRELRAIQSVVLENRVRLLEAWNEFSAASADERVLDVTVGDDALSVSLRDGRIISVPLAWYPRQLNATPAQRNNWKIAGGGYGIHWPDVDEDLSTEGLLRGAPAPKAHTPAK